ncbi:MAG: hypothetical protein ACRDDZ_01335 [Marinifilaceae bacterium]
MRSKEIDNYINQRYDRWLDFAKFKCTHSGLAGHEYDVLNEVLCSLLQKDPLTVKGLYLRQKDGYREIDWFILRMIELNTCSDRAPYRRKAAMKQVDDNTPLSHLNNTPLEEDEHDNKPDITLKQTQLVREIFESLEITELSRKVFQWKFFLGESISDWPGPESQRNLHRAYKRIETIIRYRILKERYFKVKWQKENAQEDHQDTNPNIASKQRNCVC